jgi:Na+-transporting NADH:ubiquinone oxidoreductase subunit A
MNKTIKLTKGLDIPIFGSAAPEVVSAGDSGKWSVNPNDYHGVVPRLLVQVGDAVKAGSPVFCDKNRPEIQFVAPVSGVIDEIERGDKRKLLNILIKANNLNEAKMFPVRDPLTLTKAEIQSTLLESGLWTVLKQRPYDIIADPKKTPRDIFVTGFDSSPLAPDYDFILKGQGIDFQKGLDALTRLTDGKVYLGLSVKTQSPELIQASRVEICRFEGPHPAGLVGVQINKIKPLNKGEVVYTTNALDVAAIGRFFSQGKVDLTRLVAVTGPMVRKPNYVRCKPGTPIESILNGNVHLEANLRYICGNVLTGIQIGSDGYLNPQAYQITVLKEGDGIRELFGWAMPRLNLFSFSGTYFTKLVQRFQPKKTYEPDTRILGGERALIMSGEYEKVFPMDILPEHLTRACVSGNIERQEELGIYEVAPEDFALCEYICTSKTPVQKIVREALDKLKTENGD